MPIASYLQGRFMANHGPYWLLELGNQGQLKPRIFRRHRSAVKKPIRQADSLSLIFCAVLWLNGDQVAHIEENSHLSLPS